MSSRLVGRWMDRRARERRRRYWAETTCTTHRRRLERCYPNFAECSVCCCPERCETRDECAESCRPLYP